MLKKSKSKKSKRNERNRSKSKSLNTIKNVIKNNKKIMYKSENEIYNMLKDTFNANILDHVNPIIYQNIINTAKQYINTKYDNTILKLIRNHFYLRTGMINKPITKYIGGPFHYTKHINIENNICVYTFGERHSEVDNLCPNATTKNFMFFENYMDELIKYTNVFIDFYIEIGGFDKSTYTNINNDNLRLTKIKSKFYKCIQPLTRNNQECQLSRIHYIDKRQTESRAYINDINKFSYYQFYDSENYIYLDKSIPTNLINTFNYNHEEKDFIINFIQNIPTNTYEEFKKYWVDRYLNDNLIQSKIKKSFLHDRINKTIKYKINEIIDNYNGKKTLKLVKKLKKAIDNESYDNNFFMNVKYLSNYISNYTACYTDGYGLSRIFKKFNVKNKLMQPISPKNIVIYAEDRHSDVYRYFLEKNGFVKIEEINKSYKLIQYPDIYNNRYCVDMTNATQPLFNEFI